jgi:hypothetical protein
VQIDPLRHEFERANRQITDQHLAARDRDNCVVLGVLGVEMKWFVIVEVHRDRDAVEEADPGHLAIMTSAWDALVGSADPTDRRQMSTIVAISRITSEGDPSSVAPAAYCASRTSCRRRRRPSADRAAATRCCMSYVPRTTHGSRRHPAAPSSAASLGATPGGSLFPSVPGAGAEKRAVRVDANAGPMLEQVFASRAGGFGGSRAVFEVWFSPAESDAERVAVHVGRTCVGTLDRDTSNRLRPVMEVAERRGLRQSRARGIAMLTRARDFSPPFLLVVRVPRSDPPTRLGEHQ